MWWGSPKQNQIASVWANQLHKCHCYLMLSDYWWMTIFMPIWVRKSWYYLMLSNYDTTCAGCASPDTPDPIWYPQQKPPLHQSHHRAHCHSIDLRHALPLPATPFLQYWVPSSIMEAHRFINFKLAWKMIVSIVVIIWNDSVMYQNLWRANCIVLSPPMVYISIIGLFEGDL
jgi:hypothetical protein